MLTHLSLFSGIGGLDLAAEWAGIQTVGQCEWADYPTKVLEKHWPDVPRWRDIRTLTKESFYERTGRRTVDIISGGFPCQPFSVAGKQRGKEDDRYLWPEMVRAIKELRPTWVVGENVAGIVRMALADILSELEACGYRARTFLIPACAVGARHRRYRVAIVAHADGGRQLYRQNEINTTKAGEPTQRESFKCCDGRTNYMENAGCSRCSEQENVCEQQGRTEFKRPGETLADAKSQFKRGVSIGEKTAKSGLAGGGKDVQHADSSGREKQHTSRESDQQRFVGERCTEGDVCNSPGAGLPIGSSQRVERQRAPEPEPERPNCNVSYADDRSGTVRRDGEFSAVKETGRTRDNIGERTQEYEPGEWRSTESVLGGMADGIPAGMDRDFLINHYWDVDPSIPRIATGIEHRIDRLKCLGNAVVPQQFYPIFRAIVEVEKGDEKQNEAD